MPETPAWLMDDAAAYDAMRDAAVDRGAASLASGDVAHAAEIVRACRAVDGFARAEVDAFVRGSSETAEVAP